MHDDGGTTTEVASDPLLARALAGDHDAFGALTLPHHRELRAHCYRMLGSAHDAEDVLQEVWIAAWKGLAGWERRASLRTWLYRIATHRCLNALRDARRRPAKAFEVPGVEPPPPSRLGEVPWLEPLPDALAEPNVELGPEARYAQTESISLAFVTALQLLPPRQVAVLILRDVMGFRASEVADMLDATVESANGALKRARASLQRHLGGAGERPSPPPAGSASEAALVDRFVRAYEAADLDTIVAMLTDDVFVSMPPMPHEYEGRALAARFCAAIFGAGRRFTLVAARANGQPAFGTYLEVPSGPRPGVGLLAITLAGDRIGAMTRFEHHVLPSFGLPVSLPAR